MRRVFITGGAGFVGHYTSLELIQRDCHVTIFDSFQTFENPLDNNYADCLRLRAAQRPTTIDIVRGDIRDRSQVAAAMRNAAPDVVIHLAAMPLAAASNRFADEAIQINLNGTIAVLQAIRDTPSVLRIVFVSSSFVYGNFRFDPADEDHPLDPIDIYGATKLSGETLTKSFGRRFGTEFTIVRLSAVFGPLDANRRVAQLFVEGALAGRPLVLHNGGTSRVDFTYCHDAAHGIALASLEPAGANEVFNITRGEGRSLRSLADIIRTHVPDLRTEERDPDDLRPERGGLSNEKARRLLGFRPQWSLEQGIETYVAFLRATAFPQPVRRS